jgi:hypothetical protein
VILLTPLPVKSQAKIEAQPLQLGAAEGDSLAEPFLAPMPKWLE